MGRILSNLKNIMEHMYSLVTPLQAKYSKETKKLFRHLIFDISFVIRN